MAMRCCCCVTGAAGALLGFGRESAEAAIAVEGLWDLTEGDSPDDCGARGARGDRGVDEGGARSEASESSFRSWKSWSLEATEMAESVLWRGSMVCMLDEVEVAAPRGEGRGKRGREDTDVINGAGIQGGRWQHVRGDLMAVLWLTGPRGSVDVEWSSRCDRPSSDHTGRADAAGRRRPAIVRVSRQEERGKKGIINCSQTKTSARNPSR